MTTIAAIAGSLRADSYNKTILRAAAELAPEGCSIEEISIAEFPLYNADVEAEGFPQVVTAAKRQIAEADGLLIVTPEYNNSMPGVLKNAIDWMSRKGEMGRVFAGTPVGVIGATPGGWGTKLSQTSWLPVIRALRMKPFYDKSMYVSRANKKIEDGQLTDDETRTELARYVEAFVQFVESC